MPFLPKSIERIRIPLIKCQGIKSKLIDFIASSIQWDGRGRWLEPFLGSGVVLFNIQPKRALVSDSNKHIINFYNDIKCKTIDAFTVREYLSEMGGNLLKYGADFYYETRKRFNGEGGSLDFLFLNRSCFNGLMRFNSSGFFNVPFCHKPNRFSQSYVTKISNQVEWIRSLVINNDRDFESCHLKDTLHKAQKNDFVYLDPPYAGRHADYFNSWTDSDAIDLSSHAHQLDCGLALSMWESNKYRKNTHLRKHWSGLEIRTFEHFFYIGSSEKLRNSLTEALARKPFYVACDYPSARKRRISDDFNENGICQG